MTVLFIISVVVLIVVGIYGTKNMWDQTKNY
jgi:hypothetical protein